MKKRGSDERLNRVSKKINTLQYEKYGIELLDSVVTNLEQMRETSDNIPPIVIMTLLDTDRARMTDMNIPTSIVSDSLIVTQTSRCDTAFFLTRICYNYFPFKEEKIYRY